MRVQKVPGVQYSAFALIMAERDHEKRYLLQWNGKWQVFNLIGGKLDNCKGDDNSLARTIYRELEEELGLHRETECLIVNQLKEIELQQFSYREQRKKSYHFGIFEVDLFPVLNMSAAKKISAARWLSTGRENVFVSRTEIENLCTWDGRPISATTRAILRAVGELPPVQDGALENLPQESITSPTGHRDVELLSMQLRLDHFEQALRSLMTQAQVKTAVSQTGSTLSVHEQLMQHVPAILCELLPDGTVLYVNRAVTRFTGYDPQRLYGRNWWRIFFPAEDGFQVNQLYRQIVSGDVTNFPMTLKTKSGGDLPMFWHTANQYDAQGVLQRVVALGCQHQAPAKSAAYLNSAQICA